jgi:hypothetical protein
MEPAGTNLGRFPSKFLLMIIPGLVASGVAASVLYAVHASRTPSSSEFLSDLTPQGDGLSAEERRGLTRQMLKDRRENPQEPAEVRPTPTSRPADGGPAEDTAIGTPAVGAPAVGAPAVGAPGVGAPAANPKALADHAPPDRSPPDRTPPDRAPATAPLPVARPAPAPARARAEAPVVATPGAPAAAPVVITPPAAAQSAPLPNGAADAALQPPVTANPASAAEPEPAPRGFAANVFSSLSTLAGTAANATGNTVNWVIDLPGKAISAGGKLLGGDSSASNPPAGTAPSPATVPPPSTAPPPKRNL